MRDLQVESRVRKHADSSTKDPHRGLCIPSLPGCSHEAQTPQSLLRTCPVLGFAKNCSFPPPWRSLVEEITDSGP